MKSNTGGNGAGACSAENHGSRGGGKGDLTAGALAAALAAAALAALAAAGGRPHLCLAPGRRGRGRAERHLDALGGQADLRAGRATREEQRDMATEACCVVAARSLAPSHAGTAGGERRAGRAAAGNDMVSRRVGLASGTRCKRKDSK